MTYLSTKETHSENIERLSFHILCTHINDAFQTKSSTYSSSGNSMLTSSSFSNYAFFSQTLCKQSLSNSIVNFVSTSMIEIFPLQVNVRPFTIRPLIMLCQPFCKIKRTLSTHIIFQDPSQLCLQFKTSISENLHYFSPRNYIAWPLNVVSIQDNKRRSSV